MTKPDKKPKPLSSSETRELFLAKALSYQGHRALANMVSGFGEKVGYGSQPWSGAFIDVCAREAGLTIEHIPALVYTPSGLGEFLRRNAVYQRPRRGDIVFFAFPGEGGRSMFDMMHVGIVTDTEHLDSTGLFQCLEAQTSTGLPRGNQDPSGVYLRTRSIQDAIAFGRPNYAGQPARITRTLGQWLKVTGQPGEEAGNLPGISTAHLTTGRANRAVETVQLALVDRVGLTGHARGLYDVPTRAAMAHFQRAIGRVGPDATGQPDNLTLTRLAHDTGLFRVI